ncbi:hypothetical protein SAMN04488241_102215 [Sphingomonas rubra]|uniref:Uncharacterized protein n=2 Tax=Sphingomonas rubra TaxID=634430 RepID=A0A1I5QQD5_9SPHN|nr:hypothetical protein SAMN04488241_102215 [Sphingomonas rubra]
MIALVAAGALSGGALTPTEVLSVTGSAAALVAARERRHRDMALAAGIAAGASTVGLALLPVLLGTAIAHRVARAILPPFSLAAAAVAWSVDAHPLPRASLGTWLPADANILLLATAIGLAAWIAASCAARRASPREQDAAALFATLVLPILAPIGIEAIGLAVALALGGTRLTLWPIARAANDAPLPLRRIST